MFRNSRFYVVKDNRPDEKERYYLMDSSTGNYIDFKVSEINELLVMIEKVQLDIVNKGLRLEDW